MEEEGLCFATLASLTTSGHPAVCYTGSSNLEEGSTKKVKSGLAPSFLKLGSCEKGDRQMREREREGDGGRERGPKKP